MGRSFAAFVLLVLAVLLWPRGAQAADPPRYEYTTGYGSVTSPWMNTAGEAINYVTAKVSVPSSGDGFEIRRTLTVGTPPSVWNGDAADMTWKLETCQRFFERGEWTQWQCQPATEQAGRVTRRPREMQCTAGTVASSGFYDIGGSSGANPPVLGCKNACEVVFDGSSPAGSALVNGSKHWFAKGQYVMTGGTCPETAKDNSDFLNKGTAGIPEDSCGEGKGQGSINGRTVCYDRTPDMEGGTQDDSSRDKETSKTETQKGVNPDGSEWTKEITVKVDVDGVKSTTTTTTTTRPDGTRSVETSTDYEGRPPTKPSEDDDDEEETECQKNPSSKDCGGTPASVGESYAKKTGTKSFQEVLQGASESLSGTEFGGAVNRFFAVSGGGSCPVISGHIPYIDATFSFDAFCSSTASTAFLVIRSVLLLVASFLAFRIAME